MAFFRNRLGFDVSYYHTNTIDQIIPVAVSTATGYSNKFVNAGEMSKIKELNCRCLLPRYDQKIFPGMLT